MRVFTKEVIAAVSVWAWSAAALSIPAIRDVASQICPRSMEEMQQLQDKLSSTAKIYFPGSTEFVEASVRWSNLHAPTVNVVVVPGTEQDVSETVGSRTLTVTFPLSPTRTNIHAQLVRLSSPTSRTSPSLRTMATTVPPPL
jgi:hypothetical protein